MIARILFLLVICYMILLAIIYTMQRNLQYHPNTKYPGNVEAQGVPQLKEINVTAKDGQSLYAWFAAPAEKNNKIFVIYHGNAGTLADRVYKAKELIGMGYGVYMCEYRGYGGIKGKISEDGLYADARAAIDWLVSEGYNNSQFVLYGESIGSGVAVEMAKEYKTKYLVLEGGFSSAVDVGSGMFPWLPISYLQKDRYDSVDKIKDINTSLLMLHGGHDWVINIKYAEKLFDAANHPKDFVRIDSGSHVDLFNYGAGKIIKNWLDNQKQ